MRDLALQQNYQKLFYFQQSERRRRNILIIWQLCFDNQLLHNLIEAKHRLRDDPVSSKALVSGNLFNKGLSFLIFWPKGERWNVASRTLLKPRWNAFLLYFRIVWTGNTQNAAFAIFKAWQNNEIHIHPPNPNFILRHIFYTANKKQERKFL